MNNDFVMSGLKRDYSQITPYEITHHPSQQRRRIDSEMESKVSESVQSSFENLSENSSSVERSSEEDSSLSSEDDSHEYNILYDHYKNPADFYSHLPSHSHLPLDWECAVQDLLDNKKGSVENLLKLLRSEQSKELKTVEKNILFDILYKFKNKELLLASIMLNLSSLKRNDLLRKALILNDLELVECAIKGDDGQPQMNFDDWSHQRPFQAIQFIKDKGIKPEILLKLCSVSSIDQEDIIEGEWRIFLFNFLGLEGGEFAIKGEIIEYEGSYCNFNDKILDSFNSLKQGFVEESENNLFSKLHDVVASAAKHLSSAEKFTIYSETGSLLLHGGNDEHIIDVLFLDDRVFICNMGDQSDVPVAVYKIQDKNAINAELIEFIEKSSKKFSDEQMGDYYNRLLPQICGGGYILHDPLTQLFTKHWIGSLEQEGSDCVIASTRAALNAIAAMHFLGLEETEESIVKGFRHIFDWNAKFITTQMNKYIAYCTENPTRMDKNLLIRAFEKISGDAVTENFMDFIQMLEEKAKAEK